MDFLHRMFAFNPRTYHNDLGEALFRALANTLVIRTPVIMVGPMLVTEHVTSRGRALNTGPLRKDVHKYFQNIMASHNLIYQL